MTMLELFDRGPIIPVLVLDEPRHGAPLAKALHDAGMDVLEVTLRTQRALDVISEMSRVPDVVVGAGTVTSARGLHAAVDAGARFAVSPGFSLEVVRAAAERDVALLPGVMTPSEVMRAEAAGFNALKLFPAEVAGGVALLKALRGPFADLAFCPTGGIDAGNAREYLALENVPCVGGSWIAPAQLIAERRFAEVTALARDALALARGV